MGRLRKQYFAEMGRLRKQYFAEISRMAKQHIKAKALPLVALVILVILGVSADAIHSRDDKRTATVTATVAAANTPTGTSSNMPGVSQASTPATVVAHATASVVKPAPTSFTTGSVISARTKPTHTLSVSSCATSNWTMQLQHSIVESTSFTTTSHCQHAVQVSFTQAPPYPTDIRACTVSACEAWLSYKSVGTPIILLTSVPYGTSFYLETRSNAPTTFTAYGRVFY
jgi:hypothetical protein